jgi:hypothetical protein
MGDGVSQSLCSPSWVRARLDSRKDDWMRVYQPSNDLGIAIGQVSQSWAACLVRNGVIVDKEMGNRLGPALSILRRQVERTCGRNLLPGSVAEGSFAFADKVLGLAAFRLAYLCGAREMWGITVSALALREGERRGVPVFYHRLVPSIMNNKMDELCPMERLSWRASSDWEFYHALLARGGPGRGRSDDSHG